MRNTRCVIGLLAAYFLFQSMAEAQQSMRWEATVDSAQRLAGQTNRLVLIQFWAPWCGVCKRMEAEVFSQPAVAASIAANYVPVKVNADNFPATAQQYNVTALPTTVITTPQGQMLASFRGRLEIADFQGRLMQVATTAKQQGSAPLAQVPGTTPKPAIAASPVVQNSPMAEAAPPTTNNPMTLNPSAPAASPVAPPATVAPAPTESRYADFMRQTQPSAPTPIAQPTSPAPTMPATVQPSAGPALTAQNVTPPNNVPNTAANMVQPYPSQTTQASPTYMASAAPIQQSPTVPAKNPILPSSTSNPSSPTSAAGSPFGLDGFCPVALCEKQQWVPGDRRWGANHRGQTYLFSGPEEQRRFFADPDRYAPIASGNDIVLAAEQGQTVPGMREHGVFYGNQIFLFSSESTLQKFSTNPSQYATQALGAMRNSAGQVR